MMQATATALKALNWALYLIDTQAAQADKKVIEQLRIALTALEQN
jgi:hypothetical protein